MRILSGFSILVRVPLLTLLLAPHAAAQEHRAKTESRGESKTVLKLDEGPPPELFVEVQKIRDSLRRNGNEPRAWLQLGDAYQSFMKGTQERKWRLSFPSLDKMRFVQVVTAFSQAARLKPDLADSHSRLAELYGRKGYKDLALEHLKAEWKCARKSKAHQGNAEEHALRICRLEKAIQAQEQEVKDRLDRLHINAVGLKVVDRARLAGDLGLASKSLDILLNSDIAAFGVEGMKMELDLLLNTGRAHEVGEWMSPEHEPLLGTSEYQWLKAQWAVATGNYVAADEHLQKGVRSLDPKNKGSRILEARSVVLRGLLALEAGQKNRARSLFQKAVAFWADSAGRAFLDSEAQTGRAIAHHGLQVAEK